MIKRSHVLLGIFCTPFFVGCTISHSMSILNWFRHKQTTYVESSEYQRLVDMGALVHHKLQEKNIEQQHHFNALTSIPSLEPRIAYCAYRAHNKSPNVGLNDVLVDECGTNNLIFDVAYQPDTTVYADFNDAEDNVTPAIRIRDPKTRKTVQTMPAQRVTCPGFAFNAQGSMFASKQDPINPKESWKTKTVKIYTTSDYQHIHSLQNLNTIFEFAWSPQEEDLMVVEELSHNASVCNFVRIQKDHEQKIIGSINGYHPCWNPAYACMATTARIQDYNENITLYDLNSMTTQKNWTYNNAELLETKWNSAGKLLAVGGRFEDNDHRSIDIRTNDGLPVMTLTMEDGPYCHLDDWHDNELLAHVWGSSQAVVWDIRAPKKPMTTITLEHGPVIDAKLDKQKKYIAVVPRQGNIYAFSPDGVKKLEIHWPGENIKLTLSDAGDFMSCIRLQPNTMYGGSSTPVVLTYDMSDEQKAKLIK